MKQFKQLAALFLAFALVIGLFSVPTVAYAEEKLEKTTLSESNVTVDYVTEEIVVTKDAKDSIYYTTKYAEKNHAKTEWDTAYVVAATGAAIDFSNTAANKKITYYLTNDITKKPIEVNINPQETTLVVDFSGVAKTTVKSKVKVEADWTGINALTAGYTKFNPTNSNPWTYGFLCASIKDADKKAVALTKDQVQKYLQFKKGSAGAWKSVTELDVRKYAANGAQLYFRIAPTNDEVASGSALRLGRASKEVKVTYKKQAKAPKLTIKGDTKQVSLTKTMEYRVGTATGGATVFGSWIKVADHHMNGTKVKTTYLKDLLTASGAPWNYDESEAGQVIQVRTAATDKAVASKINTVKLNAVEAPTVSTASGIEFSLVKETSYAGGIKVTNNCTSSAIQVAVVSGPSANVDLNDTKKVKWKTIAAKGTTAKSVILKEADLKAGDTIAYRFATVKDNTKTAANEFKVSSKAVDFKYKSELPLKEQQLTLKEATKVKGVVTVTGQALTGAALVTVEATSAGAVELKVTVDGTNIAANSTPKIECVKTADDDAKEDTSSDIKVTAVGKMGTTGELKITITDGAATQRKIFRVTVDGYKYYVTVVYTKGY